MNKSQLQSFEAQSFDYFVEKKFFTLSFSFLQDPLFVIKPKVTEIAYLCLTLYFTHT